MDVFSGDCSILSTDVLPFQHPARRLNRARANRIDLGLLKTIRRFSCRGRHVRLVLVSGTYVFSFAGCQFPRVNLNDTILALSIPALFSSCLSLADIICGSYLIFSFLVSI